MSLFEHRWLYLRPGERATCDDCGVTQHVTAVNALLEHGRKIHRCRDEARCARWQRERAKADK